MDAELGKELGNDDTGAIVGKHDGTAEEIKIGVAVSSVGVGNVVILIGVFVG